jgi:hypothetical protein
MKTKRFTDIRSAAALVPLAFLLCASVAHGQEVQVEPRTDDVSETGKKLSNPLGEVWALFTEFDLSSSDGALNSGHQQTGGRMTFQPILPIPLYGTGENEWKLITRPTIPFLFRQPVPENPNTIAQKAGVGDIQLPLIISPPVKNWILGAGPTLLFPSATEKAFARHQWGAGPGVVVGHYSEKVTMGVFPQYFFGVKSQGGGNAQKASYMNLLYFMYYNLPNGWQVGLSPIVTYDRRVTAGNRWNVPVGMGVSKTARVGGMVAKFELGFEYSVVTEEAFGQRAMIKLNVIPVIPSLIHKPLLGRK